MNLQFLQWPQLKQILQKNTEKNPEVIYSEDIIQDCICGTDCFHRSFLMEGYLESSIINSPLLWISTAPLTHSSTEADSTSAWLSRGTPRFRHYVRSPRCKRACACVCLRGCWSRMLIQWKGAVRDTGRRKKKPPESRRTGVVWDYLLQREGGEREIDCAIAKLCRRVGLGRNAVLTRQNRFCLLQQSESDTKLYISSTQSANVFNTLQSHINVLLIRHV